jgi:hypothetical protein
MAGDPELRCEGARELASLRLDDELSEFECRVLERHLDLCRTCRGWASAIGGTTSLLRAAPPEQPAEPVRLPRRRIALPAPRRLAVAGIAAAAALGSLVGSTLIRPSAPEPAPAPQLSFLSGDLEQLRGLPRGEHVTPFRRVREPGNPPQGAV